MIKKIKKLLKIEKKMNKFNRKSWQKCLKDIYCIYHKEIQWWGIVTIGKELKRADVGGNSVL